MRITQTLLLQSHVREIATAYARLFTVQEQLSTGKRLTRPSDDPSAIRPALDLRSSLRRLSQAGSNADLASSEFSTAAGLLQNVSDVVTRAKELGVAGANGTASADDRASMATEVDGLVQQLVALANSRGASGFLFGGSLKDVAPFEQIATRGGDFVVYRGDEHTTSVDLGDGLQLPMNVPGTEIFGGGGGGATTYQGVTGAAAGGGNDRLLGGDHLVVTHVQTVLGDGLLGGSGDSASGLQIGASSASGDTLLGATGSHTLALVDTSGTGAGGTVSLDGGPAVSWTSADGDLAVTAADGTVVHLDLTNVTAGFNGTVGGTGSGTFSLDGGHTTTAIDFTQQNQIVGDAETGSTLYVDARNVRRAGSDLVRQPGAMDLFNSLIELRDALRNGDQLPAADQVARIGDAVAAVTRGGDQVLSAMSRFGARQRLADTTKARTDDLSRLLIARQSGLEDVDVAAASTQFSEAQLALQAGLTVSARVAQLPTLVNLL
jgi:flagellin-like hook-associated protein FlgL